MSDTPFYIKLAALQRHEVGPVNGEDRMNLTSDLSLLSEHKHPIDRKARVRDKGAIGASMRGGALASVGLGGLTAAYIKSAVGLKGKRGQEMSGDFKDKLDRLAGAAGYNEHMRGSSDRLFPLPTFHIDEKGNSVAVPTRHGRTGETFMMHGFFDRDTFRHVVPDANISNREFAKLHKDTARYAHAPIIKLENDNLPAAAHEFGHAKDFRDNRKYHARMTRYGNPVVSGLRMGGMGLGALSLAEAYKGNHKKADTLAYTGGAMGTLSYLPQLRDEFVASNNGRKFMNKEFRGEASWRKRNLGPFKGFPTYVAMALAPLAMAHGSVQLRRLYRRSQAKKKQREQAKRLNDQELFKTQLK